MNAITPITCTEISYREPLSEEITEENESENLIKNKIKILVVEDELINQMVAKLMLEQLGYQADIAKNGSEALAMYQNDYQVILMDVGLPDMTGIEVCTHIRNQERSTHIPIIALTAFGDLVKNECLSSGMDDFATKPIMIDALEIILKKMIGKNNKK